MANLVQIENYLKQKGINYKVIDLGGAVYRVDEVIKAGVNPKEIVKTLIVRIPSNSVTSNRDKRKPWPKNVFFVAFAVRGQDRVDFKKVRRLFGSSTTLTTLSTGSLRPSALRLKSSTPRSLRLEELEEVNCELARPEEVEKIVGVPVGAVCPVLIGIPLIFDQRVMELVRVNLGSGDLTCGIEMDLGDLLRAVGEYKIVDISQ